MAATADTLGAGADAERLSEIRDQAARVADLARRFAAEPTPARAALASQGAGAAPAPPVAVAAPIASQAAQRLVQIDAEVEAALALAGSERQARLAALVESLRMRSPADLRNAQDRPDSRQGMTTRTEHRRPPE